MRFLTLLILFVFILAGCGRQGTKPKTTKPAAPTAKEKEARVAVYYVKFSPQDAYLVREVHNVKTTGDVCTAALEELIKGTPTTPGASTVLPLGTKIQSLRVKEGLATVDFSSKVLQANVGSAGEALGIQSIVNTLTEFPGIERVAFTVEGKVDQRALDWWGHLGLYQQPFRRNLSVVWEPVIWVTSPQPGAKVASPLTVRGTARVFEAAVNLRLLTADGHKIAETYATANAGAPERGVFETRLTFARPAASKGYLEVFWTSPKDGTEMDKVRVPVRF